MKIKELELIDLGIYIKKFKALVIADTHIGYEESLNKQGIFIPKFFRKRDQIHIFAIAIKINNC